MRAELENLGHLLEILFFCRPGLCLGHTFCLKFKKHIFLSRNPSMYMREELVNYLLKVVYKFTKLNQYILDDGNDENNRASCNVVGDSIV